MIAKTALIANAALMLAASFPQAVSAEDFTAADVLEWSEGSQNTYFETSVGMIAILASRTGTHNEIADCMNTWYWTEDGVDGTKNQLIRQVMGELPDYHPQAVILAVVEKHCGTFEPS